MPAALVFCSACCLLQRPRTFRRALRSGHPLQSIAMTAPGCAAALGEPILSISVAAMRHRHQPPDAPPEFTPGPVKAGSMDELAWLRSGRARSSANPAREPKPGRYRGYPHAELSKIIRPKQGTRLLKLQCPSAPIRCGSPGNGLTRSGHPRVPRTAITWRSYAPPHVHGALMPCHRLLNLDVELDEAIEKRGLSIEMERRHPACRRPLATMLQQAEPRQGPKDAGFHRE